MKTSKVTLTYLHYNLGYNVSTWSTVFEEQAGAVIIASNKAMVEAANEVLQRVEQRTPVGDPSLWHYKPHKGYKPGSLQQSWTMTQEIAPGGVKITIQNDMPYAERIETGAWSTQAPQGMLRITLKEFPDILDAAAKVNKL